MCDLEKCVRCGKAHLGLPMAYREREVDRVGHVCYGCEDELLHRIEAGPDVRFLDANGLPE